MADVCTNIAQLLAAEDRAARLKPATDEEEGWMLENAD